MSGAITLALVAAGAAASWRLEAGRARAALEAELRRGSGLAYALALAAAPEMAAANSDALDRVARALSGAPGVLVARVVTPDGATAAEATRDPLASALAFNADDAAEAGPRLGLPPRDGLERLARARLARTDFAGEPLAVHYFPIRKARSADGAEGPEIVGWAQVALSLKGFGEGEGVGLATAAWIGAALVLGLAISAALGRIVFTPLASLRAAALEGAGEGSGLRDRAPGESDAAFAARAVSWAMTRAREAESERSALRQSLDAMVERRTKEFENVADRALESNRVKSEFLANMSHELRTPLNSIIGFAEVLESGAVGALNPKQTRYVGNVLGSGRHLLEVINDILDLSKIEAGRMELEPGQVNVAELIQGSIAVIAPRAREKAIAVTAEGAPGLESVLADGRKLKQALYNLLSNAVKFTPQEGRVDVRATCTGADVRIAVTDSGIGIAAADRERIFNAFEQVDASSTRRYEGTGLGLALTKKFMELHDGDVELESEPGRGSTFTLVFPYVPGEESALLSANRWESAGNASARRAPAFACLATRGPAAVADAVRAAGGEPVPFDSLDALRDRAGRTAFAPAAVIAELREIARGGWEVVDKLTGEVWLEGAPIVALCASEEDASLAASHGEDARVIPTHAARLPETLAALVRRESEARRAARVLAIDPEREALAQLEESLAREGFEVLTADSGVRGLLLAGESKPDLVILEVAMEGMDGFEAIRRLRMQSANAAVPVIVYTGKDLTLQERRRLAGQIDFLAFKGQTTQGHLLHEMRAILGRRGLRLRDAA